MKNNLSLEALDILILKDIKLHFAVLCNSLSFNILSENLFINFAFCAG